MLYLGISNYIKTTLIICCHLTNIRIQNYTKHNLNFYGYKRYTYLPPNVISSYYLLVELFSLLYFTVFSKVSPTLLLKSSISMLTYLLLILCCRRACVIRGQVVAVDGTPLVGVNVSFLHHSDYGFTISRQDGR